MFQQFSDVVIMDTTMKTNEFHLPLAVLVGINWALKVLGNLIVFHFLIIYLDCPVGIWTDNARGQGRLCLVVQCVERHAHRLASESGHLYRS